MSARRGRIAGVRGLLVLLEMAVAGLAGTLAAQETPATHAPAGPADEDLDVFVPTSQGVVRLRLNVTLGGETVGKFWQRAFAELFDDCDVDGSGQLSRAEAARLPSDFCIRQVLAGFWSPFRGSAPGWSAIDLDHSDGVTLRELSEYYRRCGLGAVFVSLRRPPATARLTERLLEVIDADHDRQLSDDEWRLAATSLAAFDANADHLISPGELAPGAIYPGATGGRPWHSGAPVERTSLPVPIDQPLLILSSARPDRAVLVESWWSDFVLKRDNRHDEPRERRESEADLRVLSAPGVDSDKPAAGGPTPDFDSAAVTCRVRLAGERAELHVEGTANAKSDVTTLDQALRVRSNEIELDLWVDPGLLPSVLAGRREQFLHRFEEADLDRDGAIDPREAGSRRFNQVRQLLQSGDRDGDGRLGRDEFVRWLSLFEAFAASHAALTVVDYGSGLFEFLDEDRDGALSQRELRTARERFRQSKVRQPMRPDELRLPLQLRLIVSHGHPRTDFPPDGRTGPDWHRAMDRNRDGELSHDEFLGPLDQFELLDTDRDGRVTAVEAAGTR